MYAAAADFPYTCNELLIRGADLTLTNDYDQDAYTLTTTNNCKLGNYLYVLSISYIIVNILLIIYFNVCFLFTAQTVIENFLIGCLSKM